MKQIIKLLSSFYSCTACEECTVDGANGIKDSRDLKIMIQQFFTNPYSFNNIDYSFVDASASAEGKNVFE